MPDTPAAGRRRERHGRPHRLQADQRLPAQTTYPPGGTGDFVARFLANPEVLERFRQQAATLVGGDGPALRRVIEGELARWSEVIRMNGITLRN